jgi:hypothetical protein
MNAMTRTQVGARALPRLIALCGNPTCGKSTAAGLLEKNFGHKLVDDGLPLRQIGMQYLGLTADQVFTQAGKLETVTINDREWEVRKILGEIGNAFEEKFGGDIIPMMSHQLLDPIQPYVFGSVRRKQAHYWKKHGAVVIEIVNPLAGPSKYEFDSYDASAVDYMVLNDGLARGWTPEKALEDLEYKLVTVVQAAGAARFSDPV